MTTKNQKDSLGGFFVADQTRFIEIIECGGSSNELLADLVLCRGAGSKTVSTHGANSIALRTGMTHYRAEQALTWLVHNGFITLAPDSAKRKPKWLLLESEEKREVPLPNSLVDGIEKGKSNPPLSRIYNDLPLSPYSTLPESRIDALMVLLAMYQNHHIADFGGVNPRVGLFKEWKPANNSDGEVIKSIPNTNLALFEMEVTNTWTVASFCDQALFYVEDITSRQNRFAAAISNLERFGLFYTVTQIWSSNPRDDALAFPLYTLHVHDSCAQRTDPFLSRDIHRAAFRLGLMDKYVEFSDLNDSANIIRSGRFRYIADEITGAYPIGIFRMRFRPYTRDNGKGMAAEERRVDQWSAILQSIIAQHCRD